jgi:hypothetical protein
MKSGGERGGVGGREREREREDGTRSRSVVKRAKLTKYTSCGSGNVCGSVLLPPARGPFHGQTHRERERERERESERDLVPRGRALRLHSLSL